MLGLGMMLRRVIITDRRVIRPGLRGMLRTVVIRRRRRPRTPLAGTMADRGCPVVLRGHLLRSLPAGVLHHVKLASR
jgi:hypothetical protein